MTLSCFMPWRRKRFVLPADLPARFVRHRDPEPQGQRRRLRPERHLVPRVSLRRRQVHPHRLRLLHWRWLWPHDHLKPSHGPDTQGKRIAIPGTMTTAFLACILYQPDFEAVVTPFDKIPDASRNAGGRRADHPRSAIDLRQRGLSPHVDLGRWLKTVTTCRCRWAAMCCSALWCRRQERVLPHDARKHSVRSGQSR